MGVKLQGQNRSSLVMQTFTDSEQFSVHALTVASSTGNRLKSLGRSDPNKRGLKGKRGRELVINSRSSESSGPSRRRAPARGLQGPLWHHEPRTAAALRAPSNNNRTSNFEILFVFRCSKPGFQQRKWKRETKRAFPRPSFLSLWFLFVILYFYNKHKPLERQKTKIRIFPSFFTVNLCKNNEKILDYIRWPVPCFFFSFFFLFRFYFSPFSPSLSVIFTEMFAF